jgi:aminoglycoside phosphotransferase (APT) family kinase protein
MSTSLEPVVHLDAITTGWLTEVLSAAGALESGRVVGVERETCGTGQLADSYRFALTYDPAGAGPATVVGKFPSDDANSRAFGQQSGYYRNEIRFYEELAPTLSVVVPTALHAALAENETDFVLLMDDLAPARIVDQLVGCTADQAALVMEQAAALHAGSWKSADLAEVAWLQGTSGSFVHVTDNFEETISTFGDKAGDLVPESDLLEAGKLNAHRDSWKRVFTAPRCLWHSDLRADNLLFDAQGGALPVAVLDWQGVGYGCGTIDVAYFLGTSLTTADRRAHERDLLRHYHEALVALGVADYGADACWEDYRVLAIHGLQVGVFGLGAVKRSARGDEMWRVWIERAAAQTRDLDSYAALAAR